jgi:hypothetical protein
LLKKSVVFYTYSKKTENDSIAITGKNGAVLYEYEVGKMVRVLAVVRRQAAGSRIWLSNHIVKLEGSIAYNNGYDRLKIQIHCMWLG